MRANWHTIRRKPSRSSRISRFITRPKPANTTHSPKCGGDALAYEIKAPTTNPDVVGTAANYDLKAGSVAIKAAKVGDVSLIDNSITSKDYTINVTTGGKTLKLGTAKQKVTVGGHQHERYDFGCKPDVEIRKCVGYCE